LRLRELTTQNLAALDQVLTFLERHDIRLYRISSNIIPFASHPINTIAWWKEFAAEFRRLGKRIRKLGIRVSTHPGQYTVLNSPTPSIVTAAVGELVYQARLLDALDTDRSCKIVIHGGGLYGASENVALGRFAERARELPKDVLQRLVIENDDRLFDADEVLGASRQLGIPVVFDWLHHNANPCSRPIKTVLEEVFATWRAEDGPPKIHMSTQAVDAAAGAHADYVAAQDVRAFLQVAPPVRFDCMLEAKEKDRALLRLREELAGGS
jgi:UV DNA damage endonuclease